MPHVVSRAVFLAMPSTYSATVILELKNIIPSTTTAPDKRIEVVQKKGDPARESHNEKQHLEFVEPRFTITGSKLPAKPKNIVSDISRIIRSILT